jgi:hypothetical protein
MHKSEIVDFTLNIPKYDSAIIKFFNFIIESLFATNLLLKKIPTIKSVHVGPIRNVRGDDPLDQDFFLAEALSTLNFSDIQETNIQKSTENLCNIALQMIENVTRDFFSSMGEVMTKTGQVVDGKGKPFNFDLVLDMLEKVLIEFDENGKAKLPYLVGHPQNLAKITEFEITEEQKKRLDEIIEKKREEYYATKHYRRLS